MVNGQLPPNAETWHFPCRLSDRGVVDGDTIDVTCDLGFRTSRTVRVRLYGVDTAETYGVSHESDEYRRGQLHRTFTEEWFRDHTTVEPWPFRMFTLKQSDKYGRYLADVIAPIGESLVVALHDEFGDEVLP